MLEISKRHVIASEVVLLSEDDLVHVQLGFKTCDVFGNFGFVGLEISAGFEDLLYRHSGSESVEVGDFDGRSLFEQSLSLGIGWNEALGSVLWVVFDQVASDRAGLVEDEAIVIDVRNLTERLLFCVVGLFMLAFREIDNDQFIRNVFFLADQGDKPGAGGHRETVEFEDHVDSEIWGVGKRGIETLRRRRQRRYMLARRLCVSAESMWIRVAE